MIQSIEDIITQVDKNSPLIILYSGGLDGTYLLVRLKRLGYRNLLAINANIGDENAKIKKRLNKLDVKCIILDLVDDFVTNYVLSSIQAYAKYNGGHPLSASLSRPLIAKSVLSYIENNNLGLPTILHTSNASQNSLRRFNTSFKNLNYEGEYGSPFEKTHISRIDKLEYLLNEGLAFDLNLFSEDSNIWCREFEYGDFDNIEDLQIPEESFLWTQKTQEFDELIKIDFQNGIPVSLNNVSLPLKEIIKRVRYDVGKFGIGRYVGLEEIHTGEKVLEVREAPSATILMESYKALELATISFETARVKNNIEQLWVREASEGKWFGQLFQACNSFCKEISNSITGSVLLNLSKNSFQIKSVKSLHPNYIKNRDLFELNN